MRSQANNFASWHSTISVNPPAVNTKLIRKTDLPAISSPGCVLAAFFTSACAQLLRSRSGEPPHPLCIWPERREMIPHPWPGADGTASVADVVSWGLWASCNAQRSSTAPDPSAGPVWCSPDNHPSPLLQLHRPQWRWAGAEALPRCPPLGDAEWRCERVCHSCRLHRARAPLTSALHVVRLPGLHSALKTHEGNTGQAIPHKIQNHFRQDNVFLFWPNKWIRYNVKHVHTSSCPQQGNLLESSPWWGIVPLSEGRRIVVWQWSKPLENKFGLFITSSWANTESRSAGRAESPLPPSTPPPHPPEFVDRKALNGSKCHGWILAFPLWIHVSFSVCLHLIPACPSSPLQ